MTAAPDQLLRVRLNGETARAPWRELLRFFASGSVIAVDDELDLIDVAVCVASDDKQAVASWLQAGRVGKVSDAQASAWLEGDVELWTVVVKPWLLVQHVGAGRAGRQVEAEPAQSMEPRSPS